MGSKREIPTPFGFAALVAADTPPAADTALESAFEIRSDCDVSRLLTVVRFVEMTTELETPFESAVEARIETDTAFQSIIELIQKIRNVRAIYHVDPGEKPWLTIVGKKSDWESYVPLIERLARIEGLVTDYLIGIIRHHPSSPFRAARPAGGSNV